MREIFALKRKICFGWEGVERRRGGTMRFYFDLKNLSLLLDKFIHLIFMGRQFKIPGISFAHITHSHPSILSIWNLSWTEDNLEKLRALKYLSNLCSTNPLYLHHCLYLISLRRQVLKIQIYPQIFVHFACTIFFIYCTIEFPIS